jgi:hypothetical protein
MLRYFVGFIHGNAVLAGIVADLKRRWPSAQEDSNRLFERHPLAGTTEDEQAALALYVLQRCADTSDPEIVFRLASDNNIFESSEALEFFTDNFVETLYDYLDEHLDDQRALLALLRRYKHRCEWFRREALLALWQKDKAKGERALAEDLYEYLHDQGLEFAIEPSSASGKPDLISAQVGDERLIADAKVFKDGTGKSYLASGFHQIYQYTLDYNQPFGYLVVFKTCEDDLKFPMADQEQSIPFLVHNNKTIFFVVVDICQHEATASKRGVLKTVEVTEADLIQKAVADQRQLP